MGKFERTSAEKYEEMLKVMTRNSTVGINSHSQELEVNFLLRKAATVSTPGKDKAEGPRYHWYFQFVRFSRMAASGISKPPQL